MQSQGVMPSMITYGALMHACARGMQPERAMLVFHVMQQAEVVPSVIACNALLSACEKGNRPEQAPCVLRAM